MWGRRDFWFAGTFCVLAGLGAISATRGYVASGGEPLYYQQEFGPAVLAACGYGFHNPPDPVQFPEFTALDDFLSETSQSFSCDSLPAQISPRPFNAFQVVHGNLLMLAGLVWRITGVSWPSLAWLGGAMMGVSTAGAYLFFRSGMGTVLATMLTALWATAPLHLAQVPHLRDYSKTPFFAIMLWAVIWAGRSTPTRASCVATMAALGTAFGFGVGIRTDVATYLPVVIAALFFKWPWTRSELVTRLMAAGAAAVIFLIVAQPVLRGYSQGNNLAHVAILGLTDPSRDWLRLQPAPYSYGYVYDDGYVAAIIDAEAERRGATTLVVPGSGEYAAWGDKYDRQLLQTFPGDTLTRCWAAVRGVLALPFLPIQMQRPLWAAGWAGQMFDWRGVIVEWISIVPMVAAAMVALVMLGAADVRLAILVGGVGIALAGMTAIQFQGRHIFQLEVLAWCALGFVAATAWRASRGAFPRATLPRLLKRAALLTLILVLVFAAPIAAMRRYQTGQVEQLFSAYDSASTARVETEVVPASRESDVLIRLTSAPASHDRRFVDSEMIVAAFGGEHCDADVVGVTFKYLSEPPYPNLTRFRLVPMPPPGPQRTRIFFPVYTTGGRMTKPDAMQLAGIELAKAHQSCLGDVSRVTVPESLPIFMELMLTPEWRSGPLYEAFADAEPTSAPWLFNSYSFPEDLQPGRRWLSTLEPITAAPTFRSKQVKELGPTRIESRGRSKTRGDYLLSWPYEMRPAGAAFLVEGDLLDGGLTIGIQQGEQWVHQINVDAAGHFRAVVRVEAAGSYGLVIANHQLDSGGHHSVITRYGWMPPEH